MSALGAPRAKLIVSAAIAASIETGIRAARSGRYFFSQCRLRWNWSRSRCRPTATATSRSRWRSRDPMIRWDERASRPDGELVWGHDDVAKAMRRYLDGWEQYGFELEDIAEVAPGQGRRHLPRARRRHARASRWTAASAASGSSRGRKIASWSTYLTPKEAVRAARELVAGEPPPPKPKSGRARSRRRARRPSQTPAKAAPPSPGGARPRSSGARPRPGPASSASEPRARQRPGPRPRSSRPRWGSRRPARPWPPGPPSWRRRCRTSRR